MNLQRMLFLILLQNVQVFATEDPDLHRNVTELITSKGYPVEEYEVQTDDGYLLLLVRIPHGKNATTTPTNQVVYLQHGVMGAATDFLMNFEKNSLALALADAGYDVWLGNSRGNKYSRKHVEYSPNDRTFWDFSFNEMGIYDLPATIDYVLNVTEQLNLYYIGHSQGCTVLFVLLSEKPEYKDKIQFVIALAPVAFLSNLNDQLSFLAYLAGSIKVGLDIFDNGEFIPRDGLLDKIGLKSCSNNEIMCQNLLFALVGEDLEELNTTRLPVYLGHFPAGTSTKDIVHFTQIALSGVLKKYNYGLFGNLLRYGSNKPPQYQIETITTPIAVLWGEEDTLANPADVAALTSKLQNVVFNRKVPAPKWNHIDFIWAIHADKYLYPLIFHLLEKY